METRFAFKKYGSNEKKNTINKILLFLILQKYRKVWFKLVHQLHRYRILKEMYVWFYKIWIYREKFDQDQKQSFNKAVLFFDFMFICQILLEMIHWVKIWEFTICSSPFSKHHNTSGVYFQVGPYFLSMSR